MTLRTLVPALGLLALAGCSGAATTGTDAPAATDVTIDNELPHEPGHLPYFSPAQRVLAPGAHDSTTAYAPLPAFHLRDQDGHLITNQSLAGKVYLTDFFFATCPGICPKMQSEMLKVYKQYGQNPQVVFLSHTIDPQHDTQPVLLDYARRLGATPGGNWRFARTSRDSAYALARAYFTGAMPDAKAPGGVAHSGTFALIDDQGRVRGLYDSLDPTQTPKLLQDLPVLLAEVQTRQATAGR